MTGHLPSGVLADPHWYLDDIDVDAKTFVFVKTNRQSLSQATFLDHRWTGRGERIAIAADTAIAALDGVPAAVPNFIWHTAFCCSTLLARCIDVAGVNLSLKEPDAIEKLANIKRIGHPLAQNSARWRKLVGACLKLSGRPFQSDERVTIKPSNAANNLISEIAAQSAQGKALLLYSDLRGFLVSILKKREPGRHFARRLFAAFSMDDNFLRDIPAKDLLKLTDLQVAAMAWLVQISIYRDAVARFPNIATLDTETLLAESANALLGLDRFFGLGLGPQRVGGIVTSPAFTQNSKDQSQSFDIGQRSNEARDIEAAFGSDLDLIVAWAAKEWSHLKPLELLPRNVGKV